ncbi:MAG TPA: DUF1553 domain-containing protein [Gemmatales bacterium]|nr:DUF1553 domain-containing protein [Gemmatales bacterium]
MASSIKTILLLLTLGCVGVSLQALADDPPTAAQLEFFETRIRPVLVEHCYACHNSSKSAKGGLALDDRASFLKGGDEGKIAIPGKPDKSRLLPILRHEVNGMAMPKNGPKLDPKVIADFEKWITMGMPDPRDIPPTAQELAKTTSWATTLEKRKQWWSFQPIREQPVPRVVQPSWATTPIDAFIANKLREKQLEPSEPAKASVLVRRLYFVLTGLPPTPSEMEQWTSKLQQPEGYEQLVDHLLATPAYGERWARHWMDWIRYADSHGSEGDPEIVGGWQYRDYLIRALNADVPYDQLVREHVAGDLLKSPRINHEKGINESAIGPAHWRMVFHGFAPTDPLEEKVRFIDDEINTFSKAFLGMTVSCARCHDHKFDAISQRDYYAIFGVIGSARPGRSTIDVPEKLNRHREELTSLKQTIRTTLADEWLKELPSIKPRLLNTKKSDPKSKSILDPIHSMRGEESFETAWKKEVDSWQQEQKERHDFAQRTYQQHWQLSKVADYEQWFHAGTGLTDKPSSVGDFAVAPTGDKGLLGIYPSGVYSHLLSTKHAARLTSRYAHLDDIYDVWLQVIGDGGASARYVVQDYPRDGSIYPVHEITPQWHWQKFDLIYWNGDDIHLELTTAQDAPLMAKNNPRSWFGVRKAILVKKGEKAPPINAREYLDPIFETASVVKSLEQLADGYIESIRSALRAWKAGTLTDAQALLLNQCLQEGLLANQTQQLSAAKPLIEKYRQLENAIEVPTRVPSIEETIARNQPLLDRGNHRKPTVEVPRGFLEAMNPKPYQTQQSGRLELADDLLKDSNPFTRRVIVNRLWHHLFGRGIVATTDNFGRLGQEPTHPELLDYLASQFQQQGWSLKKMIKLIVLSKTWQLSSQPTATAQKLDPDNRLLSHTLVRRLEAEAIRDAMLADSGKLDRKLYGPPVDGSTPRRSIYVRVQRNALNPFLRVFDFPEPFSCTGQRDVTNVPAQSLTLMNDALVADWASVWATNLLRQNQLLHDEARLRHLFLAAFGRTITTDEVTKMKSYLQDTQAVYEKLRDQSQELRRQVSKLEKKVHDLTESARAQLLKQPEVSTKPTPVPISRWDFTTGPKDSFGTTHGLSKNGARVHDGALVLADQGYVLTDPIPRKIKEKTLEAWVQLSTLNQQGGGVMSVQSPDGGVFDAIVFGEQQSGQWLAGSNFFERTQPFQGTPEKEAADRPVHLAITYAGDGTITAYRNGQRYGQAYRSKGPVEFVAGQAIVSFGIRHLPAGGNRMLSGKLFRAQLYDRALTAEEVLASFQASPLAVSDQQIMAALSATAREQVTQHRQQIAKLQSELQSLGNVPDKIDVKLLWSDLTRALFNMKEFIYVQ